MFLLAGLVIGTTFGVLVQQPLEAKWRGIWACARLEFDETN